MTREEAIADLREALAGWFEEFGAPDELTLSVDVA
jgi:predicted RNase H-like HicB family nuclease